MISYDYSSSLLTSGLSSTSSYGSLDFAGLVSSLTSSTSTVAGDSTKAGTVSSYTSSIDSTSYAGLITNYLSSNFGMSAEQAASLSSYYSSQYDTYSADFASTTSSIATNTSDATSAQTTTSSTTAELASAEGTYSSYIDYMNGQSSSATAASSSATTTNSTTSAVDSASYSTMITNYLTSYFGMTDTQAASLAQYYTTQYESYNSSYASLASSLGTTASISSVTSTNQGVDALLADAQSMVGLNENTDTAAINQVTGESGIDCSTTPWCAAWAMNMLNDHGTLDTSSCSNVNYCPTIESWGKSEGIWKESDSGYIPQAGDAILFDWQGDGEARAQHIGIVQKVENGVVYTIEGNSSNSVKQNSYSLSDGDITGYLACAEQK